MLLKFSFEMWFFPSSKFVPTKKSNILCPDVYFSCFFLLLLGKQYSIWNTQYVYTVNKFSTLYFDFVQCISRLQWNHQQQYRWNRNYDTKTTSNVNWPNESTNSQNLCQKTHFVMWTGFAHKYGIQINMHKVKNHHYITVGVMVFTVKIRIVYVRQFEWWEVKLWNRKPPSS